MPYQIEVIEEAVPPAATDQAAIDFGMPMGPVELADSVGLDNCLAVADKLATHFRVTPPERLRKLVTQNTLGRKSGQEFYRYVDNTLSKPQKKALPKSYQPPVDLTERLIFSMLNEAVACLREGIVMDEDLLDAGVVFGTGFAPFLGAPVRYIQSGGLARMRHRLHDLERDHGSQFREDAGWAKLGACEILPEILPDLNARFILENRKVSFFQLAAETQVLP